MTSTASTQLLATRFTPERVAESLLPLATWHPFPTVDDRAGEELRLLRDETDALAQDVEVV